MILPALDAIVESINQNPQYHFSLQSQQEIGGGCINQTFRISSNDHDFFVKINQADFLPSFLNEAKGLDQLRATNSFRIPKIIATGRYLQYSWLILEYISLRPGNPHLFSLAGKALAKQHNETQPLFGLNHDNIIGSNKQSNTPHDNWLTFWQQQRLGVQRKMAIENGYHGSIIASLEKLIENCSIFLDHNPKATLLHGDLWSGNIAFDTEGSPVIYDPAIYYGDPECDLAMTELFGGFPTSFYDAYHLQHPKSEGYHHRKSLYNLYHILNHMNIFGGGYEQQVHQMCQNLLDKI